jgi:hypothetical protein
MAADSPEGLDTSGQILLIGPTGVLNKFPNDLNIRNASMEVVARQEVEFLLPPQSNSTLDNRHSLRSSSVAAFELPFRMASYPAAVDAWTAKNRAINNAGSMISTHNEENKTVSTGYSQVSNHWLTGYWSLTGPRGSCSADLPSRQRRTCLCLWHCWYSMPLRGAACMVFCEAHSRAPGSN